MSSRPAARRGFSAPLLSRASSSNTSGSSSPHYPKTDDQDYFTPQAPSSSLASPTQFQVNYNASQFTNSNPYSNSNSYSYTTHSTGPTAPYPIITATITSRNPSGGSSRSTPEEEDPYRQFAMHIPGPPTTLSLGGRASSSSAQSSSVRQANPLPSPMDRTRRMPPPTSRSTPQMQITSSVYAYTLSVQLPSAIQPEMVTVCANKGDKIKVVADVWHLEDESHYEWQIAFPPHDIDMGNVHARFDDNRNLTIDVRRFPRIYR